MIDINLVEIKIDVNFNAENIEEIMQNLKVLFTTPEGTVPFDRKFGLSFNIVDRPLNIAKGLLTIEYIEKVKRYEPRAQVSEVLFKHDAENGVLKPEVVIELV